MANLAAIDIAVQQPFRRYRFLGILDNSLRQQNLRQTRMQLLVPPWEDCALSINFVPERGRILICDFDLARIHPENAKERRVAVMSPRSYNGRHGAGPGRCIVIPFSVTKPSALRPSDVHFPVGPYRALTKDTWANCDSVMAVSHTRLDRVYIGHGQHSEEILSDADFKKLEAGLRHAFGCPLPGD